MSRVSSSDGHLLYTNGQVSRHALISLSQLAEEVPDLLLPEGHLETFSLKTTIVVFKGHIHKPPKSFRRCRKIVQVTLFLLNSDSTCSSRVLDPQSVGAVVCDKRSSGQRLLLSE